MQMQASLAKDHKEAAEIAELAGQHLLRLRTEGLSGRALGDAGDRSSQQLINRQLSERYPDDAILSEEAPDDATRLDRERVWIVDPLDGTREYGEPGRTDWAVHICLAISGEPVVGAVALPGRDMVLSTGRLPAPVQGGNGHLRILVSRTRPPQFTSDLAKNLGGELVEMGSAGAKAMAVLLGDAEIYVHHGGMYEWDAAAPVAVAKAAGLHASRLDGTPLVFNRSNTWLPGLLICRADLAGRVLSALSQLNIDA